MRIQGSPNTPFSTIFTYSKRLVRPTSAKGKQKRRKEKKMEVKQEDEVDGLSTVAIKTIERLIEEKDTYDENITAEPCHYYTTVEQDEAAELADENVDNLIQEVKGLCEQVQMKLKQLQKELDYLDELEHSDYEYPKERQQIIHSLQAIVQELI
jgi:hypothetical protein